MKGSSLIGVQYGVHDTHQRCLMMMMMMGSGRLLLCTSKMTVPASKEFGSAQ